MTPERHARAKQLFLDAAARPHEQRAVWLDQACDNDAELRAEVERLLSFHREEPAAAVAKSGSQAAPAPPSKTPETQRTALNPRFEPGRMIGDRYRIVALLGRGGMGEVYRAEDLRLKQNVALKFLPPAFAQNPLWLARLQREVRAARAVSNASVCRVHDMIETAGETFISMEWVEGEDLRSLLRRIGRPERPKAIEWARQICIGLAAVHAGGLLHRDLKPPNVLIDARGRAKLTDFGLAGVVEDFRGVDRVAGTPNYIAPEVLAGAAPTVRTDLFALGLTLYELFTGKRPQILNPPADPATAPASLASALSCAGDDLPPDVETALLACTAFDPVERPASALAVAGEICGADLASLAAAAGEWPSPEMVAFGTARPTATRAAALTLVATLVFLGAASWLSSVAHPIARCGGDRSPAALTDAAREAVRKSFGSVPRREEAFGLVEPTRVGAVFWTDAPRNLPAALATRTRGAPLYWYRCSAGPLIPSDPMNAVFGGARILPTDPTLRNSGGAVVLLDGDGRLIGFAAIADPLAQPFQPLSIDWSEVLQLAHVRGAPAGDATTTAPRPELEQKNWVAPHPVRPADEVHVAQTVVGGAFAMFVTYESDARATSDVAAQFRQQWSRAATVRIAFLAVLLLVALPLAWRSLRAGVADRRGAARIAVLAFSSAMAFWLLSAHHVLATSALVNSFVLAGSGAIAQAAAGWLLYIALEPLARRDWPSALTTWARLLSGRWRDAAAARHVAIGVAAGAGCAVLILLHSAIPIWLGWPPALDVRFADVFAALTGVRGALGDLAAVAWESTCSALLLFMLVVALRRILPSRRAALLVGGVVFAGLFLMQAGYWWLAIAFFAAVALVAVALLARFGVLSLVVAMFVCVLLVRWPLGPLVGVWHADFGLVALALCAALAGYGFHFSKAVPRS